MKKDSGLATAGKSWSHSQVNSVKKPTNETSHPVPRARPDVGQKSEKEMFKEKLTASTSSTEGLKKSSVQMTLKKDVAASDSKIYAADADMERERRVQERMDRVRRDRKTTQEEVGCFYDFDLVTE